LDSGNIWQRNYYEHILRDEADYERIAGYILDNPVNWDQDEENPQNQRG
jgi:REP element-mobilizing transposase RayT